MAPIRKRSSLRSRAARSGSGALAGSIAVAAQPSTFDTGFTSSKKDKRLIKHSSFVSKIEKANTKTKKRRRPSKKLVTTLESLAAALPDDDAGEEEHVTQDAKIRHKSLRSRPGAMKRKEKLEKMERDRFSKNMVQMTQGAGRPSVPTADSLPVSQTANRWAALRGFISQTMEQKAEFRSQ